MVLISIQKPINSSADYIAHHYFSLLALQFLPDRREKPFSLLLNNCINIFSMCAFPCLAEGKNAPVPHSANKTCQSLIGSRIIPKELIF
jgi:hypothetical protein